MKRVNNIYSEIYDLNNIVKATNKVLKNTKNKVKRENFEIYKMEHIINIKNRLANKNIIFNEYNIFLINDPKYRIIMSENLEDKIINHLIAEHFLANIYDNSFVDSVCSTRKNKGNKYSLELLIKYLNKIKKESDNFYVLKLDIKKYFYNIDHIILKEQLKRKIKDKDVLNILYSVIDTTNRKYINRKIIELKEKNILKVNSSYLTKQINELPLYKYNKGLALGNQTAQILGLVYLNDFNHFLKEKLHLKYVINYMDDFLILNENKEYLKFCLSQIKKYLENNLKLELNENKTRIDNIKNSINFLGYNFSIKNKKIQIKIKTDTKKRIKKRIKHLKFLYENEIIDEKYCYNIIVSYKGLFEKMKSMNFYTNNIESMLSKITRTY